MCARCACVFDWKYWRVLAWIHEKKSVVRKKQYKLNRFSYTHSYWTRVRENVLFKWNDEWIIKWKHYTPNTHAHKHNRWARETKTTTYRSKSVENHKKNVRLRREKNIKRIIRNRIYVSIKGKPCNEHVKQWIVYILLSTGSLFDNINRKHNNERQEEKNMK